MTYLSAENNEKLRSISTASLARIYSDRMPNKPNCLLVRGTHDQIEKARELLKEIALEEKVMEKSIEISVAARSLRGFADTSLQPEFVDENSENVGNFRAIRVRFH